MRFLIALSFILLIHSFSYPECYNKKPFSFIGNGYSLAAAEKVWFTGQAGATKLLPTNYEGSYHWQFFSPRVTIGYNFLPWLSSSIVTNYDFLLVHLDIDDYNIYRHEILLSINTFATIMPKIFFFGFGLSCNNRFRIPLEDDTYQIKIKDPISNNFYYDEHTDTYDKYLIYLTADLLGGINIENIGPITLKPFIDYKFTLHKLGFYSQVSGGINLNFINNGLSIMLADIVKFYQPYIRNYVHLNFGFTVFSRK